MKRLLVLAALALAGAACAAHTGTTGAAPTTAAQAPASAAPATAAPSSTAAPTSPAGPQTTFSDGTWQVGKDIAAGTYETTGGDGCYWERASDLSGGGNSTLANGNTSGHVAVTILSSDVGFKTQRCGTWSPLPSSGPQATSFGDGIYAVGIDIAPGTYGTQGGGSCYWERAADLTGGVNSITSNDNPSGPVTVTIAPSDKGFITQGCGTWAHS